MDPTSSPQVEFDRGFRRRFLWLPLLLFVVVAAPFEFTDLDLVLSDPFYDFAAKRWPEQEAFWSAVVVHKGGKFFVWGLGSVPALVLLASFRVRAWARFRRVCLYTIACFGGTPMVVAILKVLTNRDCPWNMTRYGGKVVWTRLFEAGPELAEGVRRGACFPAAHAATGFGVIALYFAARACGVRRAWLWALPGVGLGLLFGYGQQVRGAHFASHNVWSLAVGWFLALGLYRLFGGRARLSPHRAAAANAPAVTAAGSAR